MPTISDTLTHRKRTYRASSEPFAAAVTADVPFLLIEGSSTTKITVTRIGISGPSLTAVAYLAVQVEKYSTASSGGTADVMTEVPVDSNDAASTANRVVNFTGAPTAGTLTGPVASVRIFGQATTAAAAGALQHHVFDFSEMPETDGIILRGEAQGLGLVWATAPTTAVTLMGWIEWTEE